MTTNTLEIGSVSHGTMRSEDLLPDFLWLLGQVDRERADKFEADYGLTDCDEVDAETADEAVNELFDVLGEYCPPYCYFGAHEGDGSDFGCWISWDSLEDFDGLKVSDTSEIPDDYTGEVLHVNDHGNATLYAATPGHLREIWSVV